MQLEKPIDDSLNKLLHISNAVAKAFGQPPLYTDFHPSSAQAGSQKKRHDGKEVKRKYQGTRQARRDTKAKAREVLRTDMSSHFHISIGWLLNQPPVAMEEKLEELGNEQPLGTTLSIDAIKIKIGNAVTSISLSSRLDVSNGILSK